MHFDHWYPDTIGAIVCATTKIVPKSPKSFFANKQSVCKSFFIQGKGVLWLSGHWHCIERENEQKPKDPAPLAWAINLRKEFLYTVTQLSQH